MQIVLRGVFPNREDPHSWSGLFQRRNGSFLRLIRTQRSETDHLQSHEHIVLQATLSFLLQASLVEHYQWKWVPSPRTLHTAHPPPPQ